MAEYMDRDATLIEIERREALMVGDKCISVDAMKSFIKNRPALNVALVVHGQWQPVRESEMTGWQPELAGYDPIGGYLCSACKEEAVYDCNDNFVLSNYCPNCGAKMYGGDGNAESVD